MFYLAMKQMLARKKQTFLILLGIAFGTMVYVVITGLQLGMRVYIVEQLLNNTAHIRITGRERYIEEKDIRSQIYSDQDLVKWITPPEGKRDDSKLENAYGWFQFLEKEPQVLAYAPRFSVNAIITRAKSKWAVSLYGVEPQKQKRVTDLDSYIKEGSLSSLSGGGNKIILGKGAMKKLGVSVGQTVLVSIGEGETRPFKIVGVIKFGSKDIDERITFANIVDVQQLNRTPGRISEISVAIDNLDMATTLADRWQLLSQDKIESWEQANANFMQIIKIQDYVRYVITGSILLVGAFGIYNILSIMINQKQREIAILRSIGHGPEKIMALFMYQGLTLGILGAVLGLSLGTGINIIIEHINLGFDIGKGNHMLVSYSSDIYLAAFFSSLGSGLIASYLPARHASKLTPLNIIRSNL